MSEDRKKPRFFGDGDAFGDGGAWVYLGDTLQDVAEAVLTLSQQDVENCEGFEIKVSMLTDSQVNALPDL